MLVELLATRAFFVVFRELIRDFFWIVTVALLEVLTFQFPATARLGYSTSRAKLRALAWGRRNNNKSGHLRCTLVKSCRKPATLKNSLGLIFNPWRVKF